MKKFYDKKKTNESMKKKTKNVLTALNILSKLSYDNWEKDPIFTNKCRELIEKKTNDVFVDLLKPRKDVF